ncbi:hypothetical protein EFS33_10110 [Lactiplantibacillus plantarum]|nr:hypothetical protein [Lactiplantibacillus plantarum]
MVTKYHKGRHSLFLYNSEIFYAFTQDILRSQSCSCSNKIILNSREFNIPYERIPYSILFSPSCNLEIGQAIFIRK